MPTPALIAELKRLHAAMAADWIDDDGRSTDDAFARAAFQHLPALIAALESAEADKVELRKQVEELQAAKGTAKP